MEITLFGEKIQVIVVRKKVKKYSIKISSDLRIILTANKLLSEKEILRLINNHLPWIEFTIKKIKKRSSGLDVKECLNYHKIYYLGNLYDVSTICNGKKDIVIFNDYSSTSLRNFLDANIFVLINRFNKIVEENNIINVTLKLKYYKARWGCCNPSTREICLNKKLLHLPIELIDFVIYHELSHLIEANHSKKFYDVLNRFDNKSKNHRESLKRFSFLLSL